MNPLALLGMVPGRIWLGLGLAIAIAAGLWYVRSAGYAAGAASAQATLERERTAWANERTKAAERSSAALAAEIAAHNRTANELEALHDSALAARAVAERQIAAADAAASAAVRSAGRLRDALATNRLATDAALAAAGVTGLCAPATAAVAVRDQLLERFDAAAGRLAEFARASSADADRQFSAARECAGWADAVRGDFSANSAPAPQAAPAAHD